MPYLYTPLGFNPLDILPDSLKKYQDDARYFLHLLYTLRIFNNRSKTEFNPIKAAYLREIIGRRHYKPIRDCLVHSGSVETDNFYIENRKAMGYRLGKPYRDQRHQKTKVSLDRLKNNIEKNNLKIRTKIAIPVHKHLYKFLQQIELDYEKSVVSIEDEEDFTIYQISLEMIKDKDWFFKYDNQGRVHTNITNLKSSFRKFLSHNHENLVEIDISNSQPFFFGLILINYLNNLNYLTSFNYSEVIPPPLPYPLRCHILKENTKKDVKLYLDLVESGDLYEFLEKTLSIKGLTRKELKVKLFAEIFFCRNGWKTKKSRKFAKIFPTVFSVIQELKRKDYTALSRLLQKIESSAIINGVVRRCMEDDRNMFVTTIHDSVLCKEQDVARIKLIIKRIFTEYGMIPALRVKKC